MKTNSQTEKIKRIKAQYVARYAETSLSPQQLTLSSAPRVQTEPTYTPGYDDTCTFPAEVK